MKLPRNPSKVFNGANFNKGVFPNNFPKLKAEISFIITINVGATNLIFYLFFFFY